MIARTPAPPYYAVIFTSLRTEVVDGYEETAATMWTLAEKQPGFLGIESARSGLCITVSYWASLAAIAAWKAQADHMLAQEKGRAQWYSSYVVRVCLVERAYEFGVVKE